MNDPIFAVKLPQDTTKIVTEMLQLMFENDRSNEEKTDDKTEDDEKTISIEEKKTDVEEKTDDVENTEIEEQSDDEEKSDEEFYDYYGLDYGDENEDDSVGDFLADLDPEFLKSISPTLIIGYIESASPDDVKAILDNSQILLNLPPETIGLIVQKLPNDLIIQVVNSEGVKNLFLNTASNLAPEELENLKRFQADIAAILFDKLDIEVIASLPDYLVKSQLENKELLATLLNFPEKLLSVIKSFPNLLSEVPTHVVVSILQTDPKALENIPPEIIIEVLQVVPAAVLASLIPIVPDELLLQFGTNSDLVNNLDADFIENLIDNVSVDQIKLLLAHGFLSEPEILKKLPMAAVTKFAGNLELLSLISDNSLISLVDLFPEILNSVPASSAAHIAKTRPWLIGMFPLSVLSSLSPSKVDDLLALLSDQDLVNLITFQPALVNIGAEFPSDLLVKFLQSRTELLGKIPPAAEPFLSHLLVNEKFIRKLPASLLASLAGNKAVEKFLTKFAIITVLRVYPTLPSLVPPSEFLPFMHFLNDPWFRMNIPCLTVSLMSKNTEIIDILPVAVLENVITSRRILSCIPASNLEKIMEYRLRLSRLSMLAMLRSARQLPRDKYSMGLLVNFLREQVL